LPANQDLISLIYKPVEYSHVIIHTVPEYWPDLIENNKLNLGYTAWETDTLPDYWSPLLKSVDRVMVPSSFNRSVFRKTIPELPVSVVPHIVQALPEITTAQVEEYRVLWGIEPGDRVFYSINTWTTRKNLILLLHAYLLAFTEHDPVILILKTSKRGVSGPNSRMLEDVPEMFSRILSNYDNPARIMLISDDEASDETIAAIHQLGDIYVSLTHGEGWGLGTAQAAATGNSVVITEWSGHMDYLPTDSPGFLKYRLVPVQDRLSQTSYQSTQKWAEPDVGQAIQKMGDAFTCFERYRQHTVSVKELMKRYQLYPVMKVLLKAITDT
jgi:glycosyltransferase involved in cell wall biosynthesis